MDKMNRLTKGLGWMDNVDNEFRQRVGDFYDLYKREKGNHQSTDSLVEGGSKQHRHADDEYNDNDNNNNNNNNNNNDDSTANNNKSSSFKSNGGSESCTYKIQKDINRTFGLFCRSSQVASFVFGLKRGAYLKSLHHVLVAASRKYGYCQGMNFIAANFLLHYPERDSFILFCYLMEQRHMECLFNPKSAGLVDYIKVFEKRLKLHYKKVHEHLKNIGFVGFCYAIEWFTTCFLVSNPNELSACVIDMLMVNIKDTLIRIGLAVVANLEPYLLQYDLEQMQVNFKSMVMGLRAVDVLTVAVSINNRGDGEDILKRMWHEVRHVDTEGSGEHNANGSVNRNKQESQRHLSDDFGMPISPIQVYSDKIAARLSWVHHEDYELYKAYEGDVEILDFYNRESKPKRLKSMSKLRRLRKASMDSTFLRGRLSSSSSSSSSSPVRVNSAVEDGLSTEYSMIDAKKTRDLMKYKSSCCMFGEEVNYHGQDPNHTLRVKCRHRRSRRARRALMRGDFKNCCYLGLRVLKSKSNRVDGYSRYASVYCISEDVYVEIGPTTKELQQQQERQLEDYSVLVWNRDKGAMDMEKESLDRGQVPRRKDTGGSASTVSSNKGSSFADIYSYFPDTSSTDLYEKELTEGSTSPLIKISPCPSRELNLNVKTEKIEMMEPQRRDGKDLDTTSVPFAWIPIVFSDWFADESSHPTTTSMHVSQMVELDIDSSPQVKRRNHVFKTFHTGVVKDIDTFVALDELDKEYKKLTSDSDVDDSSDCTDTLDYYFSDVSASNDKKDAPTDSDHPMTSPPSTGLDTNERILMDMIAKGETQNLSPTRMVSAVWEASTEDNYDNINDENEHDDGSNVVGIGRSVSGSIKNSASSHVIDGAILPRPIFRRAGRRPIKFTKLGTAAIVNKLTMRKTTKNPL